MQTTSYAIAIGSNKRGRHGAPARTIAAALRAVGGVAAASRVVMTPALGPSARCFANAAAIIKTHETPAELLARLKAIEREFGRRPGRRWGERVIDIDIILWSGGIWAGGGLAVPHPAFRSRAFVLDPLVCIAPGWRDPVTGLRVRQLRHRQRAVDRRRAQP